MRSTFAALILISGIASATSALAADDSLSGSLTCVGSDTASALVTRWASAFEGLHPRARIQVQAAGSASAPLALTAGAADIGSMSRPMSANEEADFRKRYGYAPTRLAIARDAIVVFVHPENPLQRLTFAELDAIYSTTRRCGAAQPMRYWSDLDTHNQDALGTRQILAAGRDASSGTHEVFRESVLCNGRFRPEVIAWPGNGAIVGTVAMNREAIGYAGIGYINGMVKPLALARNQSDAGILPDRTSIADGSYPLARSLYLYVNRPPQRALAELPAAFIEFALSDEGQALVHQEGFVPLAADERRAQRSILE
ncbi:MAG: phosphate ABC transporter substrate-binding protein [Dokdonella sp.]